MNTEMNTVVTTTEIVDLIPAPEYTVSASADTKSGMNPTLKTGIIVGASVAGIAGGAIAFDRIKAHANTRLTVQSAIAEVTATLSEAVEQQYLEEREMKIILNDVNLRADSIMSERDKRMSGIFFKKKREKEDTKRSLTIFIDLYEEARKCAEISGNDALRIRIDLTLDGIKATLNALMNSVN